MTIDDGRLFLNRADLDGGHCTIPSGQAVKIDLGSAEGTYRARRCPGECPLARDGVFDESVAFEPHCRALQRVPAFPISAKTEICHPHGRPQIADHLVQLAAAEARHGGAQKASWICSGLRLRRVPRTE